MNLAEDLRALGVQRGDLVMLHVSLRALGLARSQGVADGAERVLSALEEVLGPTGTLLMILGTEYALDWVNERPVLERAALLAGTEPLRLEDAPVLPEVGFVAEAFRRRAGTLISANPSGRFAAAGARAAELLRDQPWNDYYGPGSPLDKLCAWGGRILRLGASPDTTTALHYAEYLASIPNKRRTRWDYLLATPEGPRHVWIDCLNDSEGIAEWDGEDYFALILQAYLAQRPHRSGNVAAAPSHLLEASDLVQFGVRWMEEKFSSDADQAKQIPMK
jgi:aminoglycoside N3'-acetyltransferase